MFIDQYAYGFRDHEDLIKARVGKRFGFLDVLRMGGVGSERAVVLNGCTEVVDFLSDTNAMTYANIALRKEGIVVILARDIRRLAWVVPYESLKLSGETTMKLSSDEQWLTLNADSPRHTRFFQKVKRFMAA